MWAWLFLLAGSGDWLGAEFEGELAAKARTACGKEFGVSLGTKSPVAAVRALVKGEESKEIYVQFLKDRHGYLIGRVNEIYGEDATSFTELLTRAFHTVDEKKREVRDDDAAFGEVLMARWKRAVERGWKECGEKGRPALRMRENQLIVGRF